MLRHARFDRFDICEAYFIFAQDYHGGINCALYRIFGRLSKLSFKLAPSIRNYEDLTENGRDIYNDLCRKWGFETPETA